MLIFADTAGQKIFKITCDYACHKARNSVDPGEDWGTGDGTGLFSIRPGGIINNWHGDRGIEITSITYNDLKLRFEFLHVSPNFPRPTGYHANVGDLIAITNHTGLFPNGESYPPHVHINVYEGAHITELGVIDAKGTRVDPAKYTQNTSIVGDIYTIATDNRDQIIRDLNKEIADLKGQLQDATSNNQIGQDLTKELKAKDDTIRGLQSDLDTLQREISTYQNSLFYKLYKYLNERSTTTPDQP